MPVFCKQCNKGVGFFSRKKVKLGDGTIGILCKRCAEAVPGSCGLSELPEASFEDIAATIRNAEDHEGAVSLLEESTEKIDDLVERAQRLYAIGVACEAYQEDKAMALYQEAFKLHPADIRPLDASLRLYERQGNIDMANKLREFRQKVVG